MKKKKTVGAVAHELMQKEPDSRDPIELQREMQKDYEDNIYECIDRHKKIYDDNFFVIVLTKKERLMNNVLRNYFLATKSCPSPTYDQAVYRYEKSDDALSFMWVIPSKDTCKLFVQNSLIVDPKERELLKFVLDFEDGTLLKWAKRLNNEL